MTLSSEPRLAEKTDRRRVAQLLAIIVAGFLYTSLPSLISLVQTGRQYDLANTTGTVELTEFASRMKTPLQMLFLLVCAGVILLNGTRMLRRRAGRLFLVGGGLVFLLVVDYVLTGSVTTSVLLVVIVAVAVWTIGLRTEDLRVLGMVAFALASTCLVLAALWSDAWQKEDEKGFFGEEVLAGPFSQMNVLGIALAVLLPFSLSLRTRSMRAVCLIVVLGSLVLTASRTSLIAAAVAVVAMMLLGMRSSLAMRRTVLFAGTFAVSIVMIVLPLVTEDHTLFTNRGGIWINAREFTAEAWSIGHGLSTFRFGGPLFEVTHEQAAHAHNLFLQYWAMLGVFGLAVLAIFVLVAVRNSNAVLSNTIVPGTALLAFLAMGITEVPLRPEIFDGPAWITWPIFLALVFMRTDHVAKPQPEQEVDPGVSVQGSATSLSRATR